MPISATDERRTSVRGLGEIALRVKDLDAMQRFYAEVIGLPLMTRVQNCAFFRIADGYGGHTQVLALFDRSGSHGYRGLDAALSTIDHIAFEIPLADFADEKKRLEALGLHAATDPFPRNAITDCVNSARTIAVRNASLQGRWS
jgi:catechol 2,3-dioxygenase-like lactoylglutathione lyase family enzyme